LIIFIGCVGIWAYLGGKDAGMFGEGLEASFLEILGTLFLPAITLLTGIIIFVILSMFIDHFIVPIMAIDKCTFIPAYRKFLLAFKDNTKEFLFYILISFGLGILCVLIAAMIILALVIIVLIAAAILFGIPYVIIAILLKAKLLYFVFAIIVAIPFLLIAWILLLSVNLPFAVFFRCFSLYFLTSLDCEYQPLPLEEIKE